MDLMLTSMTPEELRLAGLMAELDTLEAEISTRQARVADIRLEIAHARADVATRRAAPTMAAPTMAEITDTTIAEATLEAITTLPAPASDRLTLVKGIDAEAAALLAGLGVTAFKDIAALNDEDVRELGRMLGDSRRISKQGWIEQAALLAHGTMTDFAVRMMRGEFTGLVDSPASAEARIIVTLPEEPVATEQPAITEASALVTPAEVETATAPAAEVAAAVCEPVASCDAASAKIVSLDPRRTRMNGKRDGGMMTAGRWAALTASIIFVLGVAIEGTGFSTMLMEQVGLREACSKSVNAAHAACRNLAEADI